MSNTSIEKYNYEQLLKKINDNYDNKKDIISEYVKIFMNEEKMYIDKIKEKIKANSKINYLDMKKNIIENMEDNKSQIRMDTNNFNKDTKQDIKESKEINQDISNKNKEFLECGGLVCPNNNDLENSDRKKSLILMSSKDIKIDTKNKIVLTYINKDFQNNNEKNIKEDIKVKNPDLTNINKEDGNKLDSNNNNIKNSDNEGNSIQNGSKVNIIKEDKINNNNSEITNTTTIDKLKTNLKNVEQYLWEKYEYYAKNKYNTKLLESILETKISLGINDVSYLSNVNVKFDPKNKLNDKILKDLLDNLKLNNNAPNPYEYGYFCYRDKGGKYIEALYSVIKPELLYEDITKFNKPDDFSYPNEEIAVAYKKSRAKCFEYYINKTIFEKRYNNKPYPRIIYPLNQVFNKNPFKYNYNFYENEKEIDGCFYISDKNFKMDRKEFPFESQYYNGLFRNLEDYDNYKIDPLSFLIGDLCLIEIKTHLPNKKLKYINSKEKNFHDTVMDMLEKMFIFEQLFKDLGLEYKRIRLMLFYDLIRKRNYEYELNLALSDFKKKHYYLNYLKQVYFQVIYIDSSYFAESLKSFQDNLDNLNEEIKFLKNDNKELKRNYEEIQEKYEIIEGDNKEINKNYEDMKTKNEELEKKYNEIKENNEQLLKILYDSADEANKEKIGNLMTNK